MKFLKGQSGNPAGRPRGARNRSTVLLQNLLEGEAEAITRKVIDLAKSGDMTAIKLCMDRLAPPRRSAARSHKRVYARLRRAMAKWCAADPGSRFCRLEKQPGSRISGAPLRKSFALHRIRDTRLTHHFGRNASV